MMTKPQFSIRVRKMSSNHDEIPVNWNIFDDAKIHAKWKLEYNGMMPFALLNRVFMPVVAYICDTVREWCDWGQIVDRCMWYTFNQNMLNIEFSITENRCASIYRVLTRPSVRSLACSLNRLLVMCTLKCTDMMESMRIWLWRFTTYPKKKHC